MINKDIFEQHILGKINRETIPLPAKFYDKIFILRFSCNN